MTEVYDNVMSVVKNSASYLMDGRRLTTKNQPSVLTNGLKVRTEAKIKRIGISKLIGCTARFYLN